MVVHRTLDAEGEGPHLTDKVIQQNIKAAKDAASRAVYDRGESIMISAEDAQLNMLQDDEDKNILLAKKPAPRAFRESTGIPTHENFKLEGVVHTSLKDDKREKGQADHIGPKEIDFSKDGVYRRPRGKWEVRKYYQGKTGYFGSYSTQEQAALANMVVHRTLDAEGEGPHLTDKVIQQNIKAAKDAASRAVYDRGESIMISAEDAQLNMLQDDENNTNEPPPGSLQREQHTTIASNNQIMHTCMSSNFSTEGWQMNLDGGKLYEAYRTGILSALSHRKRKAVSYDIIKQRMQSSMQSKGEKLFTFNLNGILQRMVADGELVHSTQKFRTTYMLSDSLFSKHPQINF